MLIKQSAFFWLKLKAVLKIALVKNTSHHNHILQIIMWDFKEMWDGYQTQALNDGS